MSDLRYRLVISADADGLKTELRAAGDAVRKTSTEVSAAASGFDRAGKDINAFGVASATAARGLSEVDAAAEGASTSISHVGRSLAEASRHVGTLSGATGAAARELDGVARSAVTAATAAERLSGRASAALDALGRSAAVGTRGIQGYADAMEFARGQGIQVAASASGALDALSKLGTRAPGVGQATASAAAQAAAATAGIGRSMEVSAGQASMAKQIVTRNIMDIGNVAVATGGHITSMLSPLPDLFYGLSMQGGRLAGVWSALAGPLGLVLMLVGAMAPALINLGSGLDEAAVKQAAQEDALKAAQKTHQRAQGTVSELARQYRDLGDAMREVERIDLSRAMRSYEQKWVGLRDDLLLGFENAQGDIVAGLETRLAELTSRGMLGDVSGEIRQALSALQASNSGNAIAELTLRLREIRDASEGMIHPEGLAALDRAIDDSASAATEMEAVVQATDDLSQAYAVNTGQLNGAGVATDSYSSALAGLATAEERARAELEERLAAIDALREAGADEAEIAELTARAHRAYNEALADTGGAKSAAQAAREQETALDGLIKKYAPAAAAQAEFNEGLAVLDAAFARGLVSAEEYQTILHGLVDAYAETVEGADKAAAAVAAMRDSLAADEEDMALRLRYLGDESGELEVQLELLRMRRDLEAAGVEDVEAAIAAEEDRVRALESGQRAIREYERYQREVARVAQDVSGDVADLFWDGLTGEAKAQDALDFFKNWARRLGTEMLQQQIILPITTQIVGSMPGLFGVSRPSGAMAQAGAGGGAGGGVVGMASSLGGLGSLFGGGESVMGSIGSWIATSSLGQSLGLSAVQASAPGSVAAFGGIGQAVAGANATLTGAGEALVGGLNASPWGMIGSLGANLLGLGGGIGGSIGGMVGSVAGGALGSSMGTILGLAGGPVGAVIGGFLGSSLGGLFGGGKPKHPAGHAYVGPDGEVTRAASKHMGTGSLEVVARAALDSLNDAAAKVFGDGTRLQSGEVMAQFDNGTYALSNVQGSSFDEALPGFILKGLKQADLGTFSEDITLARKNSQAKTLDEFVSDIGFARSYRDEAEYMGPVVTPEAQGVLAAREEIAGLNQQFGVMREKVRELGLDMAPLEDAWEAQLRAMIGIGEMPEDLSPAERAVRQLRARMEELAPALTAAGIAAEEQTQALNKQLADMRQGFEQGIERTILEMTNPEEAARQDELARYETQLRDARALGADLENVHELHRLRMLEIDQQYNDAAQQAAQATTSRARQLVDDLRRWTTGLATSDLSPLSASEQYQAAGQEYWRTLSAARSGDVGEAENLSDVAERYLQAGQGYHGMGSAAYAQLFEQTRGQVSGLASRFEDAVGQERTLIDLGAGSDYAATTQTYVTAPLTELRDQGDDLLRVARSLLDQAQASAGHGRDATVELRQLRAQVASLSEEVTTLRKDLERAA